MINTVTLNPALDHILYLKRFERNITNRIQEATVTMGGKGTHVSMNLATMGVTSRAYGFGFGENGRRIIKMLHDSGVIPRFVWDGNNGESRDNYLIVELETHDASLIAARGVSPSVSHVNELYQMMADDIITGESIALSGDTSNFTDPNVYSHIIEILRSKKPRFFLDASGKTLEASLSLEPFLIKPNQDEMSFLVGHSLTSHKELIHAIYELDCRTHIYAIVVSLGGEGALARIGDSLYRVKPPVVDVYNTVGCGDCMMAGMIYGFDQGNDIEEVLRFATACAAATAESPLSVGFNLERAEQLSQQVEITKE